MEKQEAATSLAALLKSQTAVFSFDYRGLSVAEVSDLRRRVREAGGKYRVVKNSTARWAFDAVGISGMDDQLVGMTGLAWCDDDPVALAKVLHEGTRDFAAFEFKGGVVADQKVDPSQFEALAKLPGQDALRGQLVAVIAAPIRNLMNVLEGVPRNLVLVLKAAEQKAAEGGGAGS
jgi:large subunit ribosomal protein L10